MVKRSRLEHGLTASQLAQLLHLNGEWAQLARLAELKDTAQGARRWVHLQKTLKGTDDAILQDDGRMIAQLLKKRIEASVAQTQEFMTGAVTNGAAVGDLLAQYPPLPEWFLGKSQEMEFDALLEAAEEGENHAADVVALLLPHVHR
jgi:hypothetical protein